MQYMNVRIYEYTNIHLHRSTYITKCTSRRSSTARNWPPGKTEGGEGVGRYTFEIYECANICVYEYTSTQKYIHH